MAVVIATTSLPKGTVIRDKDIKLKIGSNKNSGQYFNELDDVIGRRAQRAINANQMIKPQYLTSVWMVEKDQSVILVNKSERIQVEAMGTALENGNFGDRIRVINNKSGQKLLGKVESEKKIQIISKIN
jgi:flagella basal body P-ring formation protein FlgA